ncbi:MAG TPA: PilZ domain-containing protein [Bacillota bacterium]|nr:PilZ domain-containing protein [Bacillota bacterium]
MKETLKEAFIGLSVEISIKGISYLVKQAYIKETDKYILILSNNPGIKTLIEAEMSIMDTHNIYTVMKVRILHMDIRDDEVTVTCEEVPNSTKLFQRALIRAKSDIPVTVEFLKPKNDTLIPVSDPESGTLTDFSPCGGGVTVTRRDEAFITNSLREAFFVKLTFKIPDTRHEISVIGKVVHIRKGGAFDNLGILFLINSFANYRLIETYYVFNTGR